VLCRRIAPQVSCAKRLAAWPSPTTVPPVARRSSVRQGSASTRSAAIPRALAGAKHAMRRAAAASDRQCSDPHTARVFPAEARAPAVHGAMA
jgi:hypothetical protein